MESYIDIEESIFLSRVEDRGFHVGAGRGYHVEGNFVSICLNVLLLLLLFLKMKIARGHSNSGKSNKTFPPCEGREVVPKKNIIELTHGCPFSGLHGYSVGRLRYGYFTDSCLLSYPTVRDRMVVLSMK